MKKKKDHDSVPLPPPSGPGSIRTQRIADPRLVRDAEADARTVERRLGLIDDQAAATARPLVTTTERA